MKFFVDTADTAEIAELAATGLLDGVTTNPSLIHKAGRDFIEVTREICALVEGPVSAEVVALEAAGGRVALNTTALGRLAGAAAPRFVQAGKGAIVNIGSVVGLAPEFGMSV